MNKIISFWCIMLVVLDLENLFFNDMLRVKTFQPSFDRISYFHKNFQSNNCYNDVGNCWHRTYSSCWLRFNWKFIPWQREFFTYIQWFIRKSFRFGNSQRHSGSWQTNKSKLCIYQALFVPQNETWRDAKLQTPHIVSFKSPRDVEQLDELGRQLELEKQLKQ